MSVNNLESIRNGTEHVTDAQYHEKYATSMGQRFFDLTVGQGSGGAERGVAMFGRIVTILDSFGSIDKVRKCTETTLQMVIVTQAEPAAQLVSAYNYTKDAELPFGAFKGPGALWRLMGNARGMYDCAVGLLDEKQEVFLNKGGPFTPKECKAYAMRLKANDEKKLGLASQTLGLLGSGAQVIGFGVCKPISLAKRLGADLSYGARQMAGQMQSVMLMNDIISFIKNIIDWMIEHLRFRRTYQECSFGEGKTGNDALKKIDERRKLEVFHAKSEAKLFMTQAKLTCKLGSRLPFPPVFVASLSLAAAVTDFASMWLTMD